MAIDQDFERQVDEYVERVWPQVKKDIAQLVSHPSAVNMDKATDQDPYGPDAHAALRCALQIAERLGLDAHDVDGHIGYADLAGREERYVASIAHADVVPAGPGWKADPFTMRERDGYLLGRGVLDDKGPLALSLWTAHFFAQRAKETGQQPRYTLRAIIGSDEEVGSTDCEYYLERFPQPAFLYTPDAEFPVCYGEKGRYAATIASEDLTGGALVQMDGGTAVNAVPGLASALVRADAQALPSAQDIDVEPQDDGLVLLTAHGKGGHASLPEGTVNAIGMLVSYLLDADILSEKEQRFFELLALIFSSTDGAGLNISDADEAFGAPTCIGGTIHMRDGRLFQTIDSRCTTALTEDEIHNRVSYVAAKYAAQVVEHDYTVPYLTDPESAPVRALIDCYNQVTGRDAKPFTIGGGTYARKFAHAVSFGPEEPGEQTPDWVGPMHGPEEGVSEELLRRSLKIYILATERLMNMDFDW